MAYFMKTAKLLDCALIGVCAVIGSKTVNEKVPCYLTNNIIVEKRFIVMKFCYLQGYT